MEKDSHLKSDEDIYATPELMGLAVHPPPDLYLRPAPSTFTLGCDFAGKEIHTYLLQDGHRTLYLIPDLDNYRLNRRKTNNSISTV